MEITRSLVNFNNRYARFALIHIPRGRPDVHKVRCTQICGTFICIRKKELTRIDTHFVVQSIKATALSFSYWVSVTPKINFAYDKLLIVSEISVVYLSGFLCWCSESSWRGVKDLGY